MNNYPNSLIIFGGTGDLTKRKLIPALYNLYYDGFIKENMFIVAIGRREKTKEGYRQEMREATIEFSRNKIDIKKLDSVIERIYYYQLPFDSNEEYYELDHYIHGLEEKYNTEGNRIYYLAVSPNYFGIIAKKLDKYGLGINNPTYKDGYRRILIEKPFGKDLASAKELSKDLIRYMTEENTYRIDHYLGKEMIQNILVLRFANIFFENIWNNRYVDHIQITSSETLGVQERGGYYDNSGALKDMIQNHLLQILAIVTMEPPADLSSESIINEKIKVFKSLKVMEPSEVYKNVVRGQYGPNKDMLGYREENRVPNDSNTETFVAIKTSIHNFRWAGVPMYLRTGKKMAKKTIEIVVEFKPMARVLYLEEASNIIPNKLIIKVQPDEGIKLKFNSKEIGQGFNLKPVELEFSQGSESNHNTPESYERILFEAIKGEKMLFTRWDEIEYTWRFVDNILKAWSIEKPQFPNYKGGTSGPEAANELLARDGRKWEE